MIRFTIVLFIAVLVGCISLPGSEGTTPVRYNLPGPQQACVAGKETLGVSVVKVAAGLDTDRIARVQAATGKFSYLKDVRWIESAGAMLEQRLAADLECRGFVVQTGHRASVGQSELLCELRALELQETAQGNQASVALSCVYRSADGANSSLVAAAHEPLPRWQASTAVQALGTAYGQVFDSLLTLLPSE